MFQKAVGSTDPPAILLFNVVAPVPPKNRNALLRIAGSRHQVEALAV